MSVLSFQSLRKKNLHCDRNVHVTNRSVLCVIVLYVTATKQQQQQQPEVCGLTANGVGEGGGWGGGEPIDGLTDGLTDRGGWGRGDRLTENQREGEAPDERNVTKQWSSTARTSSAILADTSLQNNCHHSFPWQQLFTGVRAPVSCLQEPQAIPGNVRFHRRRHLEQYGSEYIY